MAAASLTSSHDNLEVSTCHYTTYGQLQTLYKPDHSNGLLAGLAARYLSESMAFIHGESTTYTSHERAPSTSPIAVLHYIGGS